MGNDALIANLIALSESLRILDLSKSRFGFVAMVANRLPMENLLTSIDLSMVGNLTDPEEQNILQFELVKTKVDKCRNLTDLILFGTDLSFQSIAYLCNNLTN